MRKSAWIGSWGTTILLGFAVGIAIGKARKPEIQPRQPATEVQARERGSDHSRLFASLEKFQNDLAEKGQIAAGLRAEIEEMRAKSLPPLSPEDEKWLKERQEEEKRHRGWKTLWERRDQMVEKILQRRDKVLRGEGLDELGSLLESDSPEDELVGLWTLNGILFEGVGLDKERFKPLVLAALEHHDSEVRQYALEHLGHLGWADHGSDYRGKEKAAEAALRMVNDPHPRVKSTALGLLTDFGGKERNEGIARALRSLLQSVSTALWAIRGLAYDRHSGKIVSESGTEMWVPEKRYDYYEEMKELVIEASGNPETQDEVLKFWWEKETLDNEELERAGEILNGVNPHEYFRVGYESYPACPELRELAYDFYFRVMRESLEYSQRSRAVWMLEQTEDKSLVPQLKALAASADAEGIEQRLEHAIQRLEKYGKEYN